MRETVGLPNGHCEGARATRSIRQEEAKVARRKGLTFYQKKKRLDPRLLKDVMELLVGGAVAVFLAFVIVFSIGMRTSVIGDSMEPALHNGQEILMNRILYRISTPKRGDVVVFLPNGNQNTHFYVKRVVGLPGETVQIREGNVYIDGVLLDENELFDKIVDPGIAQNELLLEGDEFFVLGDNRNSSEDSRSGNIGAVKKDDIIGKAWFHMAAQDDSMGLIE
ncbi:MAG: signal peptidase I [Lachnospiraceae bacterium]|nr:signal peptidase I [Lachnospiraceae bacterium]